MSATPPKRCIRSSVDKDHPPMALEWEFSSWLQRALEALCYRRAIERL